MTSVILLALALAGYPLGWLWHRRRLEVLFLRGSRLLAEQVAALRIEVESARELTTSERERADRYSKKIAEFERQAIDWHRLYTEQSIGHGNAQNLMMGEIEKLARLLASKGIRYQMPRVLQAVRDEFLSNYEMPARAGLEEVLEKSRQEALAPGSPAGS